MFEDFSKCKLEVKFQDEGKTSTTNSYYLDSSGRACLSLPLLLIFPNEDLLKKSLDANCFHPKPLYDKHEEISITLKPDETQSSSIFIDAKVALTFGSGEAVLAIVEHVRVHSITVESSTLLLFETDVSVRVSNAGGESRASMTDIKVAFEIAAVLQQRLPFHDDDSTTTALKLLKNTMTKSIDPSSQNVKRTRTSPISMKALLTQALFVMVDSVSGPTSGETLLSVHIRHSCTHKEPVTITRIGIHTLQEETTLAVPQTTSSTVRWGFAENCDLSLPITLNAAESYSTILFVDASRDTCSRKFKCPVSVTAVLGKRENSSNEYRYQVTASAQAEFISSPMTSEPSDGFSLDFQLVDCDLRVGSLVVVRVAVRNLSNEIRNNLSLIVGNNAIGNKEELVQAPNAMHGQLDVSTVLNEYKLGVKGLSLKEMMNDSHDILIELDTGYLLPQIEGHRAVSVDLRFIPLRQGLVTFPHLQIVDQTNGVIYWCNHKFRAVIDAREK